ncbi:hypothetical protein NB725_003545 [Pantoea ananatis]|nr:hypothetical protein [Pantoea ananatis]MCW0341014.1 hypothetical protein [Pantoea ananatis]MCW0359383.1 hypothetical protein [Pantoea ananatis]MCW0363935.1 hypothetical protein [Pantoea ananatis]
MISGYDSAVYNDMLKGWKKTEKSSRISAGRGTKLRTECLWLNPAAQQKKVCAVWHLLILIYKTDDLISIKV